jgi:selenocysteine lyase/cysteine desulfurase
MRHFKVPGTVRPSLALYNTDDDVERLISAVYKVARKLT